MTKWIPVTVDDQLRFSTRGLPVEMLDEIKAAHTHENGHRKRLKHMKVPGWWGEPEYYATWKEERGTLIIPRGATGTLRGAFDRRGYGPNFIDKRVFSHCDQPKHRLTLRADQKLAVSTIVEKENCVIRAPTGSGKTCMALASISEIQAPALVVVWNSTLMKQWIERIESELGYRARDVGRIQGGKLALRPITVAMQQTLWKLDQGERDLIRDYFGIVVMDEVHRAAARTFVEVIDWMPARYRIGLSADERRKDRKEFLIYDQFGNVAYDVSKTELEEAKAVVDVEIRVVLTDLDAPWYADAPKGTRDKLLLDQIEKDDERTALIAELAADEAMAGEQVLVLSHRRDHCERIRLAISARGINCGLMIGGASDAAELDDAVRGLRSGELRVAVGTVQAIGTGIDLPSVSRGVIATPLATNKQMLGQVRGRFCRTAEGKDRALVYYLHDQKALGPTNVQAIKRWNKTTTVVADGMIHLAKDWLASDDAKKRDPLLLQLSQERESLGDAYERTGDE